MKKTITIEEAKEVLAAHKVKLVSRKKMLETQLAKVNEQLKEYENIKAAEKPVACEGAKLLEKIKAKEWFELGIYRYKYNHPSLCSGANFIREGSKHLYFDFAVMKNGEINVDFGTVSPEEFVEHKKNSARLLKKLDMTGKQLYEALEV